SDCEAGDHRDDRLGGAPDLDLEVEDVEPTDAAFVPVAVVAADLLVTARAEGLSAGAGQDDHADPWVVASDVEGVAELEQCSGPEGVADVGAIDRDLGNPVDRVVPDVVVVATADPIVQVSTPRAITSMVAMVADTPQKGSLPREVGGVPGEAGGGGSREVGGVPGEAGGGGSREVGGGPGEAGGGRLCPATAGGDRAEPGGGGRRRGGVGGRGVRARRAGGGGDVGGSTRRGGGRGSRDPGSPRSLLRGVGMSGGVPGEAGGGGPATRGPREACFAGWGCRGS